MNEVFADTSYFVALFLAGDHAHDDAVAATVSMPGRLVTSDWVLVEVANFFARPALRPSFLSLVENLRHQNMNVVRATHRDFNEGLDLFSSRPDKEWSLTDCITFSLMRDRNIVDALTTDHPFAQAGFNVLLK